MERDVNSLSSHLKDNLRIWLFIESSLQHELSEFMGVYIASNINIMYQPVPHCWDYSLNNRLLTSDM